MDLNELRNKRKDLAAKLNSLVKDHPADKEWTKELDDKYNAMVHDIEQIDNKLERHQKVLDLEANQRHATQERADNEGISLDEAEHKNNVDKGAFLAFMRGGREALNDDQRAALAKRLASPNNTMSTTTGSEGGFLTQEELAPGIAAALKAYGGMRNMARVISSATGSTIPWPTADATSEEGEWLAQNAPATDEDTTFGTRDIETHKISSKVIAVPFELLQDNLFDLESYINEIIGMRIGRTTEDAFVNGNGTGKPHGILADITAGKVGANGQVTSVTFDDLVDLQHSVDPAYRQSAQCGFMFHDNTLKALKKMKDDQNRPIWLPGVEASEPNSILGNPYTVNQHIPVMAADATSILYGDFSKYIIRDVMQMMFFRFTDSVYTRKGQVGFLAMMRSGGRYIDVGGAVKYYQNAAS